MVTALIVDDSELERRLLSRFLDAIGIDCVEADSGASGFRVLEQSGPVSFVLVDWKMPIQNGLEFIRRVRASDRFRDLKILMVTSNNELTHVSEALEAGADEYLMKPISVESFREKLALIGVEEAVAVHDDGDHSGGLK